MMMILEYCNKLVVNAFDIYIIIRLLKSLFQNRLCDKRILFGATAFNLGITMLLEWFTPYIWVNFVVSILLMFLLTCCYKSALWQKVLATIGIILLLTLSEILVGLLIGLDNLGILSQASNGESVGLFLSRIVFWMLVSIIQKIMTKNQTIRFSRKTVIIEIMVFSTIICELLFLCIRNKDSMIESVVLLASEVTLYLLIYLKDCLIELFTMKQQAAFMEKEKEFYQKGAVLMQQKNELEKQFRHDFKNRMQILNEIAERENVEELKRYLSEMKERTKDHEIFSNTGNLIIDSIINSKLQEAVEKEIAVTANITLPTSIEVNTDDMVVILGNLLDNAIEACERVSVSRYINISMNYEEGCIILDIKNRFDEIVNRVGEDYITRKSDKSLHGLGLKSVRNTVDKYHGLMEIASDGEEFCVDIILYL